MLHIEHFWLGICVYIFIHLWAQINNCKISTKCIDTPCYHKRCSDFVSLGCKELEIWCYLLVLETESGFLGHWGAGIGTVLHAAWIVLSAFGFLCSLFSSCTAVPAGSRDQKLWWWLCGPHHQIWLFWLTLLILTAGVWCVPRTPGPVGAVFFSFCSLSIKSAPPPPNFQL